MVKLTLYTLLVFAVATVTLNDAQFTAPDGSIHGRVRHAMDKYRAQWQIDELDWSEDEIALYEQVQQEAEAANIQVSRALGDVSDYR